MKPSHRQQPALGGLDLVSEATHVLRAAPAATLACYFAGSLPFVFGVLYFWADMSSNPFGRRHLADASLGLALLFLWMKFCHVVFARRLRAQVAATPAPAWNVARAWPAAVTQAIIQPWGLILLPLSLFIILPFPTVYAFFQNVTVLGDGESQTALALVKRSSQLAKLSWRQNVIALLVLFAFGLVVFANWTTVCFSLPGWIETLLGVDSDFSRMGFSLLNTTFLAVMFGLTYLCLDPILKTVYVLRCFYGESLQSGADLKARLKGFLPSAKSAAAVVLLLVLSVAGRANLRADEAPSPPAAAPTDAPAAAPAPPDGVAPNDLDHSIDEVIRQNKYVWRMPRGQDDQSDNADQGIIAKFLAQVRNMIFGFLGDVWDWVENLVFKLWPGNSGADSEKGSLFGAMTTMQFLLFILIAGVVCTLAVFLVRYWRNRRRAGRVVHSTAFQSTPDLTDENVGAEQLPEDGWTKLARELLERGEYRLALRAFYLSGLAHLAGRNLISLAKFKSNRDYERELRRRGHAFPDLPPNFGQMVAVFEQVWYGLHEANAESVGQFATQAQKLRAAE